ncbi:ATP-binding cassette, subfamily B, bacterial RaxB [Pararobbsia alpina]|uniref:peptidase domain-containing ABC transporter n=1 Tax=Pararobbsia alpina TaxID=621374 RepID=UPI0039A4A732
MELLDHIMTGFRRRLPVILQAESTECGLACIAMIAMCHGFHVDLRVLRRRFPISLKGASLPHLMKIAGRLDLSCRAMRADLHELRELRLPCVVHWNFNHFVVLKRIAGKSVHVHDPALGARVMNMSEFSACFTGVVLEVWPSPDFKPAPSPKQLHLRNLMGRMRGARRTLGQVFVLAAALELFSIVNPLFMQRVTDDVLVNLDSSLLTTLVVGFGISMLVQQCISAIRSWCLLHLSATLSVQWKANVFNHLLKLPIGFFERRHVGDIVSRFGSIDSIHQTLTTSFIAALLDGAMAIATLVAMCLYSGALTAVAIATMAAYALGRILTYRPFRNAALDTIVRGATQQSHFLETVRGMRAIQLYQRGDERSSAWVSLLVNQINASLKSQKLQLLYQIANGVLFGAESLLVMYIGAHLVMKGQLSIGMLIAFTAYKGQFDSRVTGLIDNFFAVKLLQLQGERLADIVLHPVDEDPDRGAIDTRNLRGEVAMQGVRYRYAHGEPTILNGVDLVIHAGERVAIVGPTGCGKTTLLNLLLGIVKPTHGAVLIDAIDLNEIGVETLRKEMGVVLQDDVLFAGSIADNVCFFDNQPNDQDIIAASISAAIHDEIIAMPMGYNTLVGDMGTALSGGQKQRILLARALYKKPRILILDEATCHLNVEKEREILLAVNALGITTILVAHRPETVLEVDRVIALAAGRVAWTGTPQEFFAAKRLGGV